jgi:hypothetical protein
MATDILNLLISNWGDILQAVLAIIGGASILLKYVAPHTKTLLDDKLYTFLNDILKWVSLNVPTNNKSKK